VVRGLPLRGVLTGGIRVGATWREPLCARGACMDAPTVDGRSVRDALAEVGFRCALDAPPPPPAGQ
jgi:hypothetical protein